MTKSKEGNMSNLKRMIKQAGVAGYISRKILGMDKTLDPNKIKNVSEHYNIQKRKIRGLNEDSLTAAKKVSEDAGLKFDSSAHKGIELSDHLKKLTPELQKYHDIHKYVDPAVKAVGVGGTLGAGYMLGRRNNDN